MLQTVTRQCDSIIRCIEVCSSSDVCRALGFDKNVNTCTTYNDLICMPFDPQCNHDPNVHMMQRISLPVCPLEFVDVASEPSGACQLLSTHTETWNCDSIGKCIELCLGCGVFAFDKKEKSCTIYANLACIPFDPQCNHDPNIRTMKRKSLSLPVCPL